MNTAKIKAYAPQARREFIQAVTEKASLLGLSRNQVEPMEIKGDVAIIGGKAFPKKVGELRAKLEERIHLQGFDQVMEAMAHTWFNRFVALRYMELHDYLGHGYRVLSNRSGSDIPEILEHAAEVDLPGLDKEKVIEFRLAGDKDNVLYRMLLVAQCNALHKTMPFLFGRIDDQTELLLPENLLHSHSPIRKLVQSIDEADWQEVEIIGWIYQFYISEKKDEVIGKVVKSEDIPAATQLFTPNWIVKYMVQNTLGRQWLATYPDSPIRDKMKYYIEPGEQTEEVKAQLAAITPSELDPESITLMDPACGSGHILVEAYDIFKDIYQERGYRTRDIPRLILEKNLYGLEIDDRAAQLAGFALLMKARADDRRILGSDGPVQLNILAIQESKGLDVDKVSSVLLQNRVIEFDSKKPRQQELFPQRTAQPILSKIDKPELSREDLRSLIDLFHDGKTFGSLLIVPDQLKETLPKFERLLAKAVNWDAQSRNVAVILLPLIKQAELLSNKFICVVTNPPYMGGKGLNPKLKVFAQANFPKGKSDLFAMFIERSSAMVVQLGYIGMVTMQAWMFLSSFEDLRRELLANETFISLIQIGYNSFPELNSKVAQACAFVLRNSLTNDGAGSYVNLNDAPQSANKDRVFREKKKKGDVYRVKQHDFGKIPGSPIAYWIGKKLIDIFQGSKQLSHLADVKAGMSTTDNDRFLRRWWEVDQQNINFTAENSKHVSESKACWYPLNKGGSYRKWFGNNEYIVHWFNNGQLIKEYIASRPEKQVGGRLVNTEYFFRECFSWGDVTSGHPSFRYISKGYVIGNRGPGIFLSKPSYWILAYLNSSLTRSILNCLNPTLTYNIGNIASIPISECLSEENLETSVKRLIDETKLDWNSYELSWDYTTLPLLKSDHHVPFLQANYTKLRTYWREMTMEVQRLEEENNRIFIEAYGLQDELTPDVPLPEITLTCNPSYRYGCNKTDEELETLLLTDTMKELISYAIGCMMGRYSLDQPGLVYAHGSNFGFDPSKYPSFPGDEDGIIPIMDMDWFPDDATHRLVELLKVGWPLETLEENLKFVAESLYPKRGETAVETIRRYFSTSFFKDHLKMYKRRPIYWLFTSGKEKAFECLVYLHRYNESTLSRMRGAYVTPLQGKLNARIEYLRNEVDAASTSSARKKLQKELDMLKKKQAELARFDEELRHYADQKVTLDLDDGVKVNYGKFGNLLAERKAVTGE